MQHSDVETKEATPLKETKEHSLKGTLYFVMFIGSFIFISWFVIYFLFLSRI
ncbi:cytochrome c oxidase subunit 2A [Salipaludibacillus neizhouensis]|uniref:Cytochrome c oxidase subunit 2A n=1 Tax=Salipaludibacillus neizhouensis TaxID=885475 RepID=A0A3A9JXA5_9BACI|nr:cytochrome c oxidase subunit 2A [Salipaludibacillus neizhouensis]RKL65107.1 cytochrome c oxidase subunit 2A [Salipaludibacillus neizhouensis]